MAKQKSKWGKSIRAMMGNRLQETDNFKLTLFQTGMGVQKKTVKS